MTENTPSITFSDFDQKMIDFQKEKNRIKELIVEYKAMIVELKSLH